MERVSGEKIDIKSGAVGWSGEELFHLSSSSSDEGYPKVSKPVVCPYLDWSSLIGVPALHSDFHPSSVDRHSVLSHLLVSIQDYQLGIMSPLSH